MLRQGRFPITHALPAARIGGTIEEGFVARVSTGWQEQVLPIKEFLDAAFSGRLRFGVPVGFVATVSVRVGYIDCWKQSCGERTRIITYIDVAFGPHQYKFSVPDLGEYPDLFEAVRNHLPNDLGIGAIRRRHSKAQARAYLSNGCIRCDSLVG